MLNNKFLKYFDLKTKLSNRSGIILIIVLWLMVILTYLAVGLGRNTHVDLALTKYDIAKVKSKYIAWAGLMFALDQIYQDSQDEESVQLDTFYQCGIKTSADAAPEELFGKHEFGDGYFTIDFFEESNEPQSQINTTIIGETYSKNVDMVVNQRITSTGKNFKQFFGFQDEERRININAITLQNYRVISSLLINEGIDSETALTIAYSIIDWKDEDSAIVHETYGAEQDYYAGQESGYLPKNLPFESPEELLLVNGMNVDIYEKIKNYITIFPKDGGLKVNFDTAGANVLRAVAMQEIENNSNFEESVADTLTEEILKYRAGADGISFTSDDRQLDQSFAKTLDVGTEGLLYQAMQKYRTKVSNYFRVNVRGVVESLNIVTRIEAVISRDTLGIVSYKRF